MSGALEFAKTMTVTQAASRGVAGLLKDAEHGEAALVTRHGRPVAAVVSISRLEELSTLESELRDAALILTRIATDKGTRVSLDEAIAAFDYSRGALEEKLDTDLAAGRD